MDMGLGYKKMKITCRQLRQIIKEEARRLSENEGMTTLDIYDKVKPLAEKVQLALQSARDPNLVVLGRIIAEIVTPTALSAVHGKDNAALNAQLEILKRYIDNTSKG